MPQQHPNREVADAITRLSDALCAWERCSSRQSVLILREEGGFSYRAMSGKPGIPDDVPDAMVMDTLSEAGQ